VRYLAGFGAGVRFGVHTASLKNLARGIVERVFHVVRDGHLATVPQPKHGVFARLASIRERLLKAVRPTPVVEREQYPDLYSGRKRGIYQRALDSLSARAVNIRDSYISTFVKAEKINLSKKEDPAPRVIQPRTPRYNLEVGRYLKLFERELCHGFEIVFGYPVVLKGMNADGVGTWLHNHWTQFDRPVAVGIDATRFDQHVSVDALKWEHSVYNGVFRSAELARLLKWQLSNRGFGRVEGHCIKYRKEGCRMSGDINTGMGNCLLMSSMILAYCESANLRVRLANNGDDCVLFVDERDLPQLAGLDGWMLDFGFTLTHDAPCYTLEHVQFCQQYPLQVGDGWRMVRDPRVAMSKDCVSLLSWDTLQDIEEWAGAIGACGMSLTSGVPVWEAWYSRLCAVGRVAGRGATERIWDSGLGYAARGVVAAEVTPEARVSFYRAFGITPDLQLALEESYAGSWDLSPVAPLTCDQVESIDCSNNPLATWQRVSKTQPHPWQV